jgi:2-polyprenyl-3-methyl-5-hydroxy-6-metoxy-1,4-benzoquinol methylase
MKEVAPDWYKRIWSLGIKEMSWVEETAAQVDFIIHTLELKGNERILDLACGFGRHSIALAEKGFRVTGVDITPAFVEDARKTAGKKGLDAEFICSDIRDISFINEFDVVLNMADGAIGYLEDDRENLKIFDRISAALKPGGRHFMDVCNRKHAEMHFPKRHWEAGEKALSLAEFSWDREKKRMLYSGFEIPFGKTAVPPESLKPHSSIRLYGREELRRILSRRGLTIVATYADYEGRPDSQRELQLMVYSRKS